MTLKHEAWLPPLALFDGALSERISNWTRQWVSHWFADPKGVSIRTTAGGENPAGRGASWGTSCGGIVLAFDEGALVRLGCFLLSVPRPAQKNAASDARLLQAVAEACLSDLLSRLAAGLGLSPGVERLDAQAAHARAIGAVMRFAVNASALGRSLDIYLSQEAAVGARKALIRPPREPRPLGSRRSAIEAQEIRVGACIGWGSLDVAELRSLAADDVFVLDAAFGRDMTLYVNGNRTADPNIELVKKGPALTLRDRRAAEVAL